MHHVGSVGGCRQTNGRTGDDNETDKEAHNFLHTPIVSELARRSWGRQARETTMPRGQLAGAKVKAALNRVGL